MKTNFNEIVLLICILFAVYLFWKIYKAEKEIIKLQEARMKK
jgi:amino acid permease